MSAAADVVVATAVVDMVDLSVVRYLMTSERMRYSDALDYVRMLRPDVRPNDGFQRQLKAFDATVHH